MFLRLALSYSSLVNFVDPSFFRFSFGSITINESVPSDGKGGFKLDLNDENVRKQVENIEASMKELRTTVKDADNILASGLSISKIDNQMAQFVNKNHRLTEEYIQDIKELRDALKDPELTKKGLGDIFTRFNALKTSAIDEGLAGGVGTIENLANRIKQMNTNFIGMYFSFYDIIRYAKELGQTVTEINSVQAELRKVSEASQTRIAENFKTSAETAKEFGATITDVISSTADWARLSLNGLRSATGKLVA